ncbi:MAG: mechanosensitive ion channel family protein [Ignavibacteria bacterium]|nr:mechanosensitive ion channel family protein [Ignavibacteria bacterium]
MSRDPLLFHTFIAVLIVAGSAIIGGLLRSLIGFIAKRLATQTAKDLDDRIIGAIESKAVVLTIIAGCSIAIREVRKGLIPADVTAHQILDYLSIGLFILLVVILAQLASRLIRITIGWYTDRVSIQNRSDVSTTIVPFTSKLVNIVVFFIVTMIILDYIGVNIGGFLVSLGVGSLAIALAAQETIANMIAWFVILVDQPVRLGDRIKLPTGEEGEVYQIGLRSTRILNQDNNLVIIPNGDLIKSRIVNLTLPDFSTRIVVEVNVAYGTNVERARSIMINLAHERMDIQKHPAPEVHVINLGDAAIRLRLSARTPDVAKKFSIETALRERIYEAFRQAGIEIPVLPRLLSMKDSDAAQTLAKK